ncbi:MAG: hypothetical protein JXX29_07360 [Deltaproteobacteria bacterium]|nr:hypothetical protein [Deltaproteobacteria bacterium]
MLIIQRLMHSCSRLLFHLDSPKPDADVDWRAFAIRGWVANNDRDCRLLLNISGQIQEYEWNEPRRDVDKHIEDVAPSFVGHGFHIPLQFGDIHSIEEIRIGVRMYNADNWLLSLKPTEAIPKGILFGGSNSIIIGGFADGLQSNLPNLKNVAVGTSSSLQNLFELIRHGDEIANADFIITESNVNDSLAAAKLQDVPFVVKNADWYYRELSRSGLPVFVLMMPLKRDGSTRETPELIREM